MKIIKRNGSEVPFDITKIITAVTKASDSVGGKSRLTREQINQIADDVTEQCQALNRAVSVEEIQDMVENQLADIEYIRETAGLSYLPENLKEMALLRLEYPDAPLAELGTYLNPPVGKSGVNHRLRRISEMADSLRQQTV